MSQEKSREAILKVRSDNQKLAERIEQGTAYHEPVEVYFTDRTRHSVEVYAISEREFTEACKKAGTTPDILPFSPEVLKAQAEYNAVMAEHGPKSEEAMKAARAVADAQRNHPMKPEQVISSLQLVLAMAEASTHDPGIADKLLGNSEGSKIAIKAFELMKPPKEG